MCKCIKNSSSVKYVSQEQIFYEISSTGTNFLRNKFQRKLFTVTQVLGKMFYEIGSRRNKSHMRFILLELISQELILAYIRRIKVLRAKEKEVRFARTAGQHEAKYIRSNTVRSANFLFLSYISLFPITHTLHFSWNWKKNLQK